MMKKNKKVVQIISKYCQMSVRPVTLDELSDFVALWRREEVKRNVLFLDPKRISLIRCP